MNTIHLENFSKTQILVSVTGAEYANIIRKIFIPKFGDLAERTYNDNGTLVYMFVLPISKSKFNWTMIRHGLTKKFSSAA